MEQRKPYPKMIVDQFWNMEEGEKYRYIQDQLHLEHYSRCSGEALNDGRRFIGLVRRQANDLTGTGGNTRYYIYPIDCLDKDENFGRSKLFVDILGRSRIMDRDKNGIAAAKNACAEVDEKGRGQKVVTAEYYFVPAENRSPNERSPVRVSNLRVLDLSQAELHERIKAVCAEVNTLTDGVGQLEAKKGALEKECQELEDRRATLEKDRQELELQRQALEEKLAAVRGLLERDGDALRTLETTAHDFAERLRAYGLEADLAALGLSLPEKQPPEPGKDAPVPYLPTLAAQVRDAIFRDQKLYYAEHIIREFLGAMFTNQIIILSGPPGTGKSSLPQAVARCTGAQCRMVSVQPSWTDNQDLLGFYDPTRERFAATPFLDILAEAKSDPDTVYLVCLDEMNLVRVEYYFSEILSAMETEEKELRLYSPYSCEMRRNALQRRLGALSGLEPSPETAEEARAIQDKLALLNRYEAAFRLPDNVQFVGTLNMDETTKGLSPKVLDRSFIIELDRTEPPAVPAQGSTPPEAATSSAHISGVTPSSFQRGCGLSGDELAERKEDLKKQMTELNKQLKESEPTQEISVSLSARGQTHAEELLRRGLEPGDVYLGKVLSAMRYTQPEQNELLQKEAAKTVKELAAARGKKA